jgi:hypothetical protein
MKDSVRFEIEDKDNIKILTYNGKPYLNCISAIKYHPTNEFKTGDIEIIEGRIFNKQIPEGDELIVLLWLKDSISILIETGRKFMDNPFLIQDLTLLYWQRIKSIYSNSPEDSDLYLFYKDALEKYFYLCKDDRNGEWFKRKKLDREEEILSLVFFDWKKSNYHINPVIIEDKDGILEENIKRWFLANYDTFHLRKFESITQKMRISNISDNDSYKTRKDTAPEEVIRRKYDLSYNFCWFLIPLAFLFILSIEVVPEWILGVVCSCTAIVIIVPIYIFFKQSQKKHSILLRLFGCILAGYVPIISVDISRFAANQTYLTTIVLWIVFGFFTHIYIYKEIFNKIQKNKLQENLERSGRGKALSFLLRAAGYSLIIGLFISDFFSTALFSDPKEGILRFPFILSYIYPKVIVNLAPFAMFIGIFINLLWEDKALTEPM